MSPREQNAVAACAAVELDFEWLRFNSSNCKLEALSSEASRAEFEARMAVSSPTWFWDKTPAARVLVLTTTLFVLSFSIA